MQCTAPTRPPRIEIRPDVWLDARLALWLAPTRTLVVADVHWGYAASHRAEGNLLPMWGDAEIAGRLRALIADYRPDEMVWLGDSLHTLAGRAAAEDFLTSCATPVTLIAGNHDARWPRACKLNHVIRGPYYLHHGDRAGDPGTDLIELVGHFHPAFILRDGAGTHLKLPALIVSPRRLILPAFSPWAAGAPWVPAATETLYAIGTKRIFTVSPELRQKQPFP